MLKKRDSVSPPQPQGPGLFLEQVPDTKNPTLLPARSLSYIPFGLGSQWTIGKVQKDTVLGVAPQQSS